MTKTTSILKKFASTALIGCVLLSATACSSTRDRIANIGKEPQLSQIKNPIEQAEYKPVSIPMPAKFTEATKANSLWQAERVTFFKDQRAHAVGDILTVMIEIDDKAELDNETTRTRDNSEGANFNQLLGIPQEAAKLLPGGFNPLNPIDVTSTTSNKGTGKIDREEKIKLKLAAMITQKLPNGNFVIYGKQEVRVNFEKRELAITGIIRPEDITIKNDIEYEKIAEARIAYGGQGHLTDVQQPRYGQQFFDVVFPF